MYLIQVLDEYNGVDGEYSYDTLEETLNQVRCYILEGTGQDKIKVLREIYLDIEVNVKVK